MLKLEGLSEGVTAMKTNMPKRRNLAALETPTAPGFSLRLADEAKNQAAERVA